MVDQNILESVEVVQQVGDSDKYTPELEHESTVENTQEGIQCEGDSCDNTSTTPAFKLPKKYTPPQAKWAPTKGEHGIPKSPPERGAVEEAQQPHKSCCE